MRPTPVMDFLAASSVAQASAIRGATATATAAEDVRLPLPPPVRSWPGSRRMAAWYTAFAVYAGIIAVVSGASYERTWGYWAVAAYSAAALVSFCWRSQGRNAALLASLTGALAAPLTWLAALSAPTPDVQVVSRAAALLLQHGTPYLSSAQIAHLGVPIAYNPYLPAMAVFGLPRAVGVPGAAGDPRLWLAVATAALLALAFRLAGRGDAVRCSLFAVASPVVAFPLVLGTTDAPVLALVCVALALLSQVSRTRLVWAAAVVVGIACGLKYTAWPALPVIAAMLAAQYGARMAVRFGAVAAATTVVLVAALDVPDLGRPTALIQNTVLFPLGLTRAKTPAASPLPGHLLAMQGPTAHLVAIGLLITAGLAVAVSLVLRPPADAAAAAWRLIIGLTLMFGLSPATRFGYFAYPIGLCGWLAMCHAAARARREPAPGSPAGTALSWPRRALAAAQAARG